MKKSLLFVLAVIIFVGVAVSPCSAVILQSPDARLKSSVWVGVASNGATPTSGSAITSANRIVGFRVSGTTTPAAALYDAAANTASLVIDEAGAASNSESVTWYPAPRSLATGLYVQNNLSTTYTTVYYE